MREGGYVAHVGGDGGTTQRERVVLGLLMMYRAVAIADGEYPVCVMWLKDVGPPGPDAGRGGVRAEVPGPGASGGAHAYEREDLMHEWTVPDNRVRARSKKMG